MMEVAMIPVATVVEIQVVAMQLAATLEAVAAGERLMLLRAAAEAA